MTFYWIYDLANWQLGVLIVVVNVAAAVGGLFLTRRPVKKLLHGSDRHNEVVSWVFAGVGVFYGLALGLIAVATWENFTAVDGQNSKEAASIAALFNDLDGYPEPLQSTLQNDLRQYTRSIIEKDWPSHRQGLGNDEGTRLIHRLEDKVMAFDPKSERDKINHGEVIKDLDEVIQARQLRLSAVSTGLPATLWMVVVLGAILSTALLYLFWVDNLGLHMILVGGFATFVALLLFLTAAMDNPFRGQFSVSPDNYQEVLDKTMTPAATAETH